MGYSTTHWWVNKWTSDCRCVNNEHTTLRGVLATFVVKKMNTFRSCYRSQIHYNQGRSELSSIDSPATVKPRVLLLEDIFEDHEHQVRSSISLNTTQWGLPLGFPRTSSIKISAERGVRVHPLTAADTYSSLFVVHGCTKRNSDRVQTGTGITRRHIPFSVWTMANA